MRLSRIGWLAMATVVVVGLALFFVLRMDRRERTLEDGSVLRLAKVKFGKWEPLKLDGLLDQLKAKLPPSWLASFSKGPMFRGSSSWYQNTAMHTNNDALYIYLTRIDPLTGTYRSVDASEAELVDEHGCVYPATQAGGEDDGRLSAVPGAPVRRSGMGVGYSVGWFRFEAFPRHESKFRLRVFSDEPGAHGPKLLGEMMVHNPAPPSTPTNWMVQSLPITNTVGDVSFVLTELKVKTNSGRREVQFGYPYSLAPKYQIFEAGQRSTNWQALDTELYDSSGNFASKMFGEGPGFLSTRETAWKLRVRFFGSEAARSASNAVWTLHGLEIPDPGSFTNLQSSQELLGVKLKVIAFAGIGEFVYSNSIPAVISPSDVPGGESSVNVTWNNNRRGASTQTYTVHGLMPHLMVEMGQLNEDQRLTVRATDEQGRDYYAYQWHNWGTTPRPKEKPGKIRYLDRQYGSGDTAFFVFDLPKEVKKVDVIFCLHASTVPEFIFKPPTTKIP